MNDRKDKHLENAASTSEHAADAPDSQKSDVPMKSARTALDVSARERENAKAKMLIVGVGASAGGLDALIELFRNIRPTGAAYVVLQHLSPQSQSSLPHLLQKATILHVTEAADGDKITADVVHVVAPNADIAIRDGTLSVWQRQDKQEHLLPIDFLFRSLAEDQGAYAVGIILSGMGTDGAEGLRAIQAAGGTTFVQDAASARFSQMPEFAYRAGYAQFRMAPAAIGEELERLGAERKANPGEQTSLPSAWLEELLSRVKQESGFDFAHYKPSTLIRRIERRATLMKCEKIYDYLVLTTDNAAELKTLGDDLLINVTRFFRDKDFYSYLAKEIVPELVGGAELDDVPLRVWVSACATGEEAYSIGMLFATHMARVKSHRKLQIFATDLSDKVIDFARRGIYPLRIADEMDAETLARFFTHKNSAYFVKPFLRSLIVFSRHDLLIDPPFSRISFVSCRNVLIYLRPNAQKQVFNRLHYALLRHGFLALGTSESASEASELFSSRELRHKVYAKKPLIEFSHDIVAERDGPSPCEVALEEKTDMTPSTHQEPLDASIVGLFGLGGIVVDTHYRIVETTGDITGAIKLRPGQVHLDLSSVFSPQLRLRIRRAVDECRRYEQMSKAEVAEAIPTVIDPSIRALSLERVGHAGRFVLVVLSKEILLPRSAPQAPAEPHKKKKPRALKSDLLEQLAAKQRMIESLEANLEAEVTQKDRLLEALAAAEQDSQSRMEELQSTIEELETSKEEMQSANEEITVVNEELRTRMDEIENHQSDLYSLLAGLDVSFVLLGSDGLLRRYSKEAEERFGFRLHDIGEPITYLQAGFSTISFDEEIARAHKNREPLQQDAAWREKTTYTVTLKPVSNKENGMATLVIMKPLRDAR